MFANFNLKDGMAWLFYCLLASIFLIEPIVKVWFSNQTFYIPYTFGFIGMIFCIIQFYRDRRKKWEVSWIDALLSLLLVYNLTNILRYDYLPEMALFVVVYLITKQFSNKHKIGCIFTISGCLQVFLMFLQLYGLLPFDNDFFPAIGSFDNPGPLGGYLAICFVATIGNFQYLNRWTSIACSLLLGASLVFSDSRAAWLGVIMALLYMGMQFKGISLGRQICVFALLLVVFGAISLSVYKPDSAKGRLMTWEICISMIKDHPVCGQGFSSFQREFMINQANYIQQYSNTKGRELATNNCFAFNEFIHITCEQGVVGLLLVLVILILLTVRYIRCKSILFPCLITFVLFACFSYPCNVFLLSMTLALLLGALSDGSFPVVNIQSVYPKTIAIAICFSIMVVLGYQWMERIRMEKALSSFLHRDDYQSLNYIQQRYASMKNSSEFIFRYARLLYLKGEYELAIPVVKQAIFLYPTTDKYCDLGDIFQHLDKSEQAERSYQYAVWLLPNLAYPRYCLFLLYKESGRKWEATKMARQILEMTPKKANERYDEMIHFVKEFLLAP